MLQSLQRSTTCIRTRRTIEIAQDFPLHGQAHPRGLRQISPPGRDQVRLRLGVECRLDMVLTGLDAYLEVFDRTNVHCDIKNIAASGNVVFSERVETNYNLETRDKFV